MQLHLKLQCLIYKKNIGYFSPCHTRATEWKQPLFKNQTHAISNRPNQKKKNESVLKICHMYHKALLCSFLLFFTHYTSLFTSIVLRHKGFDISSL